MKRDFLLFATLLVPALALPAHASPPAATEPAKPAAGLDLGAIDRSIDPCTDFYQYACGGWMKANPVPADQARWGRFNELDERNKAILRGILEQAAAGGAKRRTDDRKIGDYYASCIDEAAIERTGIAALKPQLDRIARMRNVAELPKVLSQLHKEGVGAVFSFDSGQDYQDATQVIAQADQGGLGLPDRDYYVKSDAKSVELRRDYVAHVQRMLKLTGEAPADATADASTVLEIETALAQASMELAQRREPDKVYHRLTTAELQALTPRFAWNKYFTAVGTPKIKALNVVTTDFFKGVDAMLGSVPVEKWRAYLRWHVVHAAAPLLSKAVVDENFAFYGKRLTGAVENRPRWKRCVEYTDGDLGFVLGKAFVNQAFGAEGKERTLKMVKALEQALGQDIDGVEWMTPETRKQARVKLAQIANKIGFPDKWRDYSKLKIARGDAFGNSQRANIFEFDRRIAKIGKPVDRGEWDMTPPTVNAYYDPQKNDINFPAGILQLPFYANDVDDALNFGGIGAVIGHELTHGFDDEGGQFDGSGNLKNWWTDADLKAFQERGACIAAQYGNYLAIDDVKLNGKLTEGENIADNGGVRVALMALQNEIDKQPTAIDGFTPEQRFFLSFGQIWCQNTRPEESRRRAVTDPHSPGRYRVNGVLQNTPEFLKTFGCKADAPMASKNICRVW